MTGAAPNAVTSRFLVERSRNQRARPGGAQARTQPPRIQVLVKAGPAIFDKAFVDPAHFFQLISNHGATNRKDRQYSALVTQGTVVVAFSQFPASLDRDRANGAKGAEIILEVSVGCSVRPRRDGDNGNVSHRGPRFWIG